MRDMLVIALLAALLGAAGLHFMYHKPRTDAMRASIVALEDSNRGLQAGLRASERDRQLHRVLLARRIASEAVLRASRDTLEADLAAALAQNPAWSETPVPQEVQDAVSAP